MDSSTGATRSVVIRFRVSDYTRFLLNRHYSEGKWRQKWSNREEWLRTLIEEPLQYYEKTNKRNKN